MEQSFIIYYQQKQESDGTAFLHLLLSYYLKIITYLKTFQSYEKKF